MRTLALILAVLCVVPMTGGCSVAMALEGSPDPDLDLLATADRATVEAQLGAPASETVAPDGTVECTYAFARGNEPSAFRAVTHVFFDVLTFGIWEIAGVMIENAVDEKDRELRVVYAQNDQVIALHEIAPARLEEETAIVTAESDGPE